MTVTATPDRHALPTPTHHPAPALLVDFAVGASSPAEGLMIELHLAFCSACRRSVQLLFNAAGELLDSLPAEQLAVDLFDRTLHAIQRPDPATRSDAVTIPHFAAAWPRPLGRYVARHHLRKWRRLPAGFRALRIPFADRSSRVWVMRAPGGRGSFPHAHTHDEWTVVLQGGFSDETGTYNAGDFAYAGPQDAHKVVAEPAEGCVCVLLVRAAPVYTTLPGKLLAPFMRV